jgi:hypothetical protein
VIDRPNRVPPIAALPGGGTSRHVADHGSGSTTSGRQPPAVAATAGTAGRGPVGGASGGITVAAGSVRLPAEIEAFPGPGGRQAIELRIVDAGTRAAGGFRGPGGAGLAATVAARSTAGGLVLDVGGGRVRLPPGLVDLPEGAVVGVQLVPAGGAAPIVDRPGLDRLLAGLLAGAAAAAADGDAAAAPEARRLSADATLGTQLLAAWRTLGQRGAGDQHHPGATEGDVRGGSGGFLEAEGRGSPPAEREATWRTPPALLTLVNGPAVQLNLWRREPDDPAEVAEAHVRLTVELSRLGDIAVDLRVTPSRVELLILSPTPLPEAVRAELGQAVAAAAELEHRTTRLAFRSHARPAAQPGAAEVPPV